MISRTYILIFTAFVILVHAQKAESSQKISPQNGIKVNLSATETEWLKQHPVIRVGPDPAFPPIEWFDKKGELDGIAAEYLEIIQDRTGLKFTIVKLESWETVLDKTRAKEVDVWSAAAKNPEREKYMRFTSPYLRLPAVIIVRSDKLRKHTLESLKGKKVGVTFGYAVHDYLMENYPELEITPMPDVVSGLRKLAFGGLDAFIANIATASYYIEKEAIMNLHVAGETGFIYQLSFAVRKDWPELAGILEKALATLTGAEKSNIVRKHIIEFKEPWLTRGELTALILIIGGGLGIGFVLTWNRSLKNQVKLRTEELSRELAERKKMEDSLRHAKEQAERANRMKTEMLANTSHELRTPLNSIMGFSRHLLKTEITEEQRKPLKIIQDSSEKLLHLINTLLDAGTVEHGIAELDETPFNFIEFMEMTIEIPKKSAEAKGLGFIYQISPNVPAILIGDCDKLMQISKNILNNAIKFTQKGELNMKIYLDDEQKDKRAWIHFAVKDTGIGIPEDKKSLVFENFKQVDGSISRKFEGIGIGASTSKQFAELMGGRLWFESVAGAGTTFHWILPFSVP